MTDPFTLPALWLLLSVVVLGALAGAAAGYAVMRWYSRTRTPTAISPTGHFCEGGCGTPVKLRTHDGHYYCSTRKATGSC